MGEGDSGAGRTGDARRTPPFVPDHTENTVTLAGFTGLTPIRRGGDSVVYWAHQLVPDRDVAIKVLDLAGPDHRHRFEREIRLTVELGRLHPNIMKVLDTKTLPDGRPCLVMDYYEMGSTHDRLIATGPFAVADVVAIGRVIADALGFAHSRRVLHRDVKPQNIMILPTSYVLADFGIARPMDAGHTSSLERLSYRHASPEVLDGAPPEAGDDLWSLGSTLFTLLSGRAPFAADDPADDTALAYLRRVRLGQRRPMPAGVPPELVAVLQRAMDPVRDRRYRAAPEMLADLRGLDRELDVWAPPATVPSIPVGDAPGETAADTAGPPGDAREAASSTADPVPAWPAPPEHPAEATHLAPRTPAHLSPDDADRADDPDDAAGVSVPAAGRPPAGSTEDWGWAPTAQPTVPDRAAPTAVGTADPALGLAPSVASALTSPAAVAADPATANGTGPPDPDAALTGLRPPDDRIAVPAPGTTAPAQGAVPRRIRARILLLALVMLLASGVAAYFITRPSNHPTSPQVGVVAPSNSPNSPFPSRSPSPTATSASLPVVGQVGASDPDLAPTILTWQVTGDTVTVKFKPPSQTVDMVVLFDATFYDFSTGKGQIESLAQVPPNAGVIVATLPDADAQATNITIMLVGYQGSGSVGYSQPQTQARTGGS